MNRVYSKVLEQKEAIAAGLMLFPFFIQRVFLGGIGEYENLPFHIDFRIMGYLCHFFIVIGGVFILFKEGHLKKLILPAILGLSLFIVHLFNKVLLMPQFTILEFLISNIRGWLWLSAIIIYSLVFFKFEIFKKVLLTLVTWTCVSSLLFLLYYRLTGIPLNLHMGYGVPRVQGFLSEPSALALLLPIAAIFEFQSKNYIRLALICLTVFFSQSVFVILGLFLATLFYGFFFVLDWKKIVGRVILFFVSIFYVGSLFIYSGIAHDLYISKNHNLERLNPNKDLSIINRLVFFLEELPKNIQERNTEGDGSRIVMNFLLIDKMIAEKTIYLGYGLNALGSIYKSRGLLSPELGLSSYLLSSLGLLVLGVVFLFHRAWTFLLKTGQIEFLLFSIITFLLSFFNSAGGIHAYTFPLLCLFYYLWSLTEKKPLH